MKIKNIFIPFLFVLMVFTMLFACKQNNTSEPSKTTEDSIKKQALHIDTFSASPEVDSCSCFFSTDSSTYHHQSYICAYDLSTIAFMKINGAMTRFTQTEYDGAGNGSVTKFKSDLYELLLETSDTKEIDAGSTAQLGSIRITNNKEGVTVITTFYGQCGCKKPF